MVPEAIKICNKCKIIKFLDDFYKDKSKKDKLSTICKLCHKEYILKHIDYILEFNRKRANEYYKTHKEKILNYRKKYYETHKIEIKEYKKIYRKIHKDVIKKYNKIHRNKINKDKIERRKKDVNLKILNNLRSRIRCALKKICKSKRTLELLGCSIEQLKEHLQKQFKKGMNWENYGYYGWHVDHIKPCCTFDLTKPEEQHKCFHYTNLQPLWAKENQQKGDKC